MYATPLPDSAATPLPADIEPTLEELFERLADDDWHPQALAARLAAVGELAPRLTPQQRTRWLDALHRTWQRHGWALSVTVRVELLRLAAGWQDWPLTAGIGEQLAGDGELPEAERLTLARAWRHLGDAPSAEEHARHYLLAKPRCAAGVEEFAAIGRWRAFRARLGLDRTLIDDGEGLMLEPLAHHPIGDFALQYFDPAIAELCCLPHFENDEHWHFWLDEIYGYGDQLPFAVLHQEWGFIGVVSLILQEEVGFFYYWVGPDFQGNGIGPRAASLLLNEAAARWGMNSCYAKVFDYNTPSRKGLAKLGFEELGIQAVPPDEREIFYRVGPPAGRAACVAQLHRLLERMGSSTTAAAPLSA